MTVVVTERVSLACRVLKSIKKCNHALNENILIGVKS